MNRQQLMELLRVEQMNDYTWRALLPELSQMWAVGHSEQEAKEQWLEEYDQPMLSSLFAQVFQKRATHPIISEEDEPESMRRPMTVDFPYRGKLYRIVTNEGPPKRHIVLPDGRVLVVCEWAGRVPSALADVRSPEPMIPETIVKKLDGVLAVEIPLQPGQTTQPMAVLDFGGQRYAVAVDSGALVEMPDGQLYRIESTYPGLPVRIATIVPYDPHRHSYDLDQFGTTLAIPAPADYPGMVGEPQDLRIHFRVRGERFILSHEAYEQRKEIVHVPGHGFYHVGIYLETIPIQLGRLSPLPNNHYDPSHVADALLYADSVDIEREVLSQSKDWVTSPKGLMAPRSH